MKTVKTVTDNRLDDNFCSRMFFFKNNYEIICKIESVYKETLLTGCFIVFPSPPPPLAVGVSCGPRFPTHSPDSGLGSSEHPG